MENKNILTMLHLSSIVHKEAKNLYDRCKKIKQANEVEKKNFLIEFVVAIDIISSLHEKAMKHFQEYLCVEHRIFEYREPYKEKPYYVKNRNNENVALSSDLIDAVNAIHETLIYIENELMNADSIIKNRDYATIKDALVSLKNIFSNSNVDLNLIPFGALLKLTTEIENLKIQKKLL